MHAHPHPRAIVGRAENSAGAPVCTRAHTSTSCARQPARAPAPAASAGQAAPVIKSIRVDPKAHTIAIEAEGCQDILWVSGGKLVARGSPFILERARGAARYVRARIRGEHGYTYTQPFPLRVR